MIQRSILVAEDLKKNIHNMAQDISKLLREDLKLLRPGLPSEEILKTVHTWPRPEMVIMGAGFEEVITKSDRPVLVVGPRAEEKFSSIKNYKPRRILVPTDLTRASRPAEQYAMSLAARLNAELVLYHSVFDHIKRVNDASIMSGFAGFDLERIFQKMTRDAGYLLDKKQARFLKVVGKCQYKIAESGMSISESLLQESKHNYCLIVMGTHSRRNALVRAFLGSTARDTISKAEIPVVVVHSR